MDDVNEIKDSNSHYFSEISNDKPTGSGWIFNLYVANYSLVDFVLIDSHFRRPKSIITPTTGDVWMDRKNNSPKVEQLFGNWNRISENVTTLVQFSSLAPLAQQAATPCKLIIPGHTIDCTVQLVTELDLQNLSGLSPKGKKCAEILQEIYNQNNLALAIVNGGNVEISEQLFSGYSGSPLVQIINGRASLLGTLFWSLPGHPTFVIKHEAQVHSNLHAIVALGKEEIMEFPSNSSLADYIVNNNVERFISFKNDWTLVLLCCCLNYLVEWIPKKKLISAKKTLLLLI